MLWKGRRESDNVEDQRALGGKTMGVGTLVVGAFVYYLLGGNPLAYVVQNLDQVQPAQRVDQSRDDDRKRFVSVVLADTEDVWGALFKASSRKYQPPKLVLFRGMVESGCGRAGRQTGPFYCPLDQRVYMDLSFLDDLARKLGAPGEFAGAYVVAHEVGHHVQTLLGLDRAVRQKGLRESERNRASVQLELQADCLAGVWARQTQDSKNVIERGDVDQAIGAAAAVGDDRLQKKSQGYVVPDSFTHGSSADRTRAFRTGFDGGELASCVR